jgi:tetratricopeptide (TPR) repeat protein
MSNENKEKTQQELNKAINFLGQNKFSEAESICKEIIKDGPNPDAYHILSSIKLYNQDFDESVKLVDESIKLNNKNPGYYVTLGCAYSASKEYQKSVEAFNNAILLNDKIAQIHFYLGESYRKLKKYNDAISSFYKTIELSPEHVAAYLLLGIVYQEKKQFDLSIKSFLKCIEIMPDYAEAHLNLGLCYLLIGDYKNGWREYEWRKKIIKQSTDGLKKEWSGQSLRNKKLLILDEGSDANLINFIRFGRELAKDDCEIILQCSDQAMSLMSSQKWLNNTVTVNEIPEHDYYVHIGSLMKALEVNPNETNQDYPYLEFNNTNLNLNVSEKINIGLVLETDRNSNAHDDESMSHTLLKGVFSNQHNVISLDPYVTKENQCDIFQTLASYSDLNELANIVSNLDLVITVDHLVAHMAGALNKKTILMLPCVPNWRWELTHRNTSPWYKSVTMFRQEIPGDWESVIIKIKEQLEEIKYG